MSSESLWVSYSVMDDIADIAPVWDGVMIVGGSGALDDLCDGTAHHLRGHWTGTPTPISGLGLYSADAD